MSALTSSQEEDLANFLACVGIDDRNTALQYLTAHNWDLMPAVNTYFAANSQSASSAEHEQPPSHFGNGKHASTSSRAAQSSSHSHEAVRTPRGASVAASAAPAVAATAAAPAPLNTSAQSDSSSRKAALTPTPSSYTGLNLRSYAANIPGLAFLSRVGVAIGDWTWRHLPSSLTQSLMRQATPFLQRYRQELGDDILQPDFFDGRYARAAREAKDSNRPMLMVLHSDFHEDASEFCRETLGNPDVVNLLNSRFICWIGSVHESDAYRLSQSLGPLSYPFSCILNPRTGSSDELVLLARCDGAKPADQYMTWLRGFIDAQDARAAAQVAESFERDSERILREQQQVEFESAMQADFEREQEEEAERARQRDAQARAEQQALAEQRELEREAQLALEAEQRAIAEAEAQERERVRILNSLPDEPDAADKSAVALQFRLPDGRQVARRFSGTEPLATIFVYLGTQELKDTAGETIKQWELIAHYPKRALTDRTQTLKDAGLVGRAVLFVQEVVG